MASPTQIRISTFPTTASQPELRRSFAFVVATGLLNTLIAAYLFLRLPEDHHPSLISLGLRAISFVIVGAAAGTVGSWFYWRRPSSPLRANLVMPFHLFALAAAAGWVWIPAVILLSREDSPLTSAVGVLCAISLATALRPIVSSPTLMAVQEPGTYTLSSQQLFAATLQTPDREVHSYFIALGIYLAAYGLRNGWILDAAILLAVCAFFCAWKRIPEPTLPLDSDLQTVRAAYRLASVLPLAFLITLFSLLHGIGHRNHLEALAAAEAQIESDQNAQAKSKSAASEIAGYHSLILWPAPKKKQIIAPIPQPAPLLVPGENKPLIIKFDGPYLYFQPPSHGPSANAHQAHGTPLAADIQTNNFVSLVMEAHQALGTPIPIARLRAVQLGILNSDNHAGLINIAVLLTDSSSPGNQLYLGQKPVVSSQPKNFDIKFAPIAETLSFPVPASPKLRKFDEITVMFFPDVTNYNRGAKVAIQQFELMPR